MCLAGLNLGMAGEINIRTGRLLSLSESRLLAIGSGPNSNGGTIRLKSEKDLILSGQPDELGRTLTNLDVSGNSGGTISIEGENVALQNARVVSDTGSENGGNISITGRTVDISATRLDPNEILRIGTAGFGGEPGALTIHGEKICAYHRYANR